MASETPAQASLRKAHEAISRLYGECGSVDVGGHEKKAHAALDEAVREAEPEELLAYRWVYKLTPEETAELVAAYRARKEKP